MMREEIWQERIEQARGCFAAGLSQAETVEYLGINPTTLRTYIRRGALLPPTASKNLEKIAECAARGLTRAETAAELGLSNYVIGLYGRENAVPFRHASAVLVDPRSEPMAAMYKAGKTLEEIGAVYAITRERVRQIMKKYHGIVGKDGGQSVRAETRKGKATAKRNAKFMARYGCSYDDYLSFASLSKDMLADGCTYSRAPLGAYRAQERSAKRRGIEWDFTILEWWDIWQKSGKWEKRGRGQGYMMCRFGDAGPYAVGNVYIATGVHNGAVQPNNPYRIGHPDHDVAVSEMVRNGFKRHSADQHRTHIGLPKGVTLHKRSGRYTAQASIKGVNTYLGMFSTPEQAHDAYLLAISLLGVARAA